MTAIDVLLQVRYVDFDMNRHLNNGVFVNLMETARLQLSITPLPEDASGQTATLEARFGPRTTFYVTDQYIEYQLPADFRIEPIRVRIGVSRIGRSSFDYQYEFRSEDDTLRYAIAFNGMTLIDNSSGRPIPLSDPQRRLLAAVQCEPLKFRRLSTATTS
jgi:acyl-CoA thioester hydrolase